MLCQVEIWIPCISCIIVEQVLISNLIVLIIIIQYWYLKYLMALDITKLM